MTNTRKTLLILFCTAFLVSSSGFAATATSKPAKSTPGLEAAKTISLITGVAISPLLGVGAAGAYTWFNVPEERRSKLDWYAQPWFWVPALLLVGLIGLKDILGTGAPAVLKKPFDVAEAIENKISGLIAAGAFLPLVISVFPEAAKPAPEALGPLAALGFAAIDPGAIGNALLIPFALAMFVVVWLASHAITMLILLSPFSAVDAILKSARLALLGLVAGTSYINPYLGAAFSIVVIVVAYFIAGWSFRLTVMGTEFMWDFMTLRRRRFQPGTERNKMFTSRAMNGVPVRTYGALVHSSNDPLRFEYRPWLLLPRRTLELPKGNYVVGRGLFYPEISIEEGDRLRSRFTLPPRYNRHEEALARAYGFGPVRDVGMRRGLKAAWAWIRGLAGSGPATDSGVSQAPG